MTQSFSAAGREVPDTQSQHTEELSHHSFVLQGFPAFGWDRITGLSASTALFPACSVGKRQVREQTREFGLCCSQPLDSISLGHGIQTDRVFWMKRGLTL